MPWLISYEQYNPTNGKRDRDHEVTDLHPADWLIDCAEYDAHYTILHAIEITPDQAARYAEAFNDEDDEETEGCE
jgi:hypothetical protein